MFYLFWILIMEFVCVSQIVCPVLRLPAETGVQLQPLDAVPSPQEVVPVQQLSHELGVLEIGFIHVIQGKVSPQFQLLLA